MCPSPRFLAVSLTALALAISLFSGCGPHQGAHAGARTDSRSSVVPLMPIAVTASPSPSPSATPSSTPTQPNEPKLPAPKTKGKSKVSMPAPQQPQKQKLPQQQQQNPPSQISWPDPGNNVDEPTGLPGDDACNPGTPAPNEFRAARNGPTPLCLALHYVVYRDETGAPVQDLAGISQGLEGANRIWDQCGIRFHTERLEAVDPRDHGLAENVRSYPELSEIRREFEDSKRLLVVTTGDWDRSGSIGNTGANAWTSLPFPGQPPGLAGSILEGSVGGSPQMLAHELGHYLGLGHRASPGELMHPFVSNGSEALSDAECARARATALNDWSAMLR